MTKRKLFVWACDYSQNTGEGKLGRLFIKEISNQYQFKTQLSQKKIIPNKYLSTIQGVIYCWKRYLDNQNVCYLNYLPLWNFLIFFLLPPKTILGPITGGAFFSKKDKINYFIRKLIFPVFYKISEIFLNLRQTNIIFSTDLLKRHLSKKTVKKSKFNYVFKSFLPQKKKKKEFDFIIYYRKHANKNSLFPYEFIKKLTELKYKVYIIGDKLKIPLVKNFGYISNYKLSILQSKAKYTIASYENLYTLFVLECLSHNVKIIVNNDKKQKITFHKKRFIKINFNSINKFKL